MMIFNFNRQMAANAATIRRTADAAGQSYRTTLTSTLRFSALP